MTRGRAIIDRLRDRARREQFQPTRLGVITNPAYIIRSGLFKAIRQIAPTISGRVMDLGCGSKPYENLFNGASDYVGVDIDVSGHDHATSKVDIFYDGVTLPFDDGSFDAIVAFEVFEHVFNLPTLLTECRRVIRQGGTLMFTIPFAWGEHEQPYDFARYTQFGIRSILTNEGFSEIDVRKSNGTIEAVSQVLISYVYEHMLPRNRWLRKASQLIVMPPLVSAALIIKRILPKSDEYYSNLIVVARR